MNEGGKNKGKIINAFLVPCVFVINVAKRNERFPDGISIILIFDFLKG